MYAARMTMIAATLAVAAAGGSSNASAEERVTPSAANPATRNFDDPDLVYAGGPEVRNAPLVVFMPGTGGRSENAPDLLLKTIAQQGYRVVYLTYNDTPAVAQFCPDRPPVCSARFRNSRVFGGEGPPQVFTPEPEAIAQRLTDLLRYLDREHPDQGWNIYLDPQGRPKWPKLVLSGLSQGAGMAAFMAKRFPVDRVVLFSSPWDFTGPDQRPAPWLYDRSATPPDRWWAERHVKENTTEQIAHAYAALAIPNDHILLFDGGLPAGDAGNDGNPYHGSTIRLPQYVPQWRTLYGTGAPVARPDGVTAGPGPNPRPAPVPSETPPAVGQLVGTWRVTGVAVPRDGVQALVENDPSYMGREVVVTPQTISWKAGSKKGGTTDDVCTGFSLQLTSGASKAEAQDAALLHHLTITPHQGYAVRCGSGSWGPASAGATAFYVASPNLIAIPWYDGAMLKLKRED